MHSHANGEPRCAEVSAKIPTAFGVLFFLALRYIEGPRNEGALAFSSSCLCITF